MRKGILFVVVMCFLMVGCGGGGSSDSPTPSSDPPPVSVSAAGFWEGTIVDGTGTPGDALGIVSSDGEIRFVNLTTGVQGSGHYTISGDQATGTITAYASEGHLFDGSSVADGTITFRATEKTTLEGSYDLPGDQGTFTLAYVPVIEGPVAQADLEGHWGYNLPDDMVDFQVDAAGVLNGIDDINCRYSGNVEVIDPDWNVFRVTLNVSNCLAFDGSYSGLSTLDIYEEKNILWLMVSSPKKSVFDGLFYSPTPWDSQ